MKVVVKVKKGGKEVATVTVTTPQGVAAVEGQLKKQPLDHADELGEALERAARLRINSWKSR